MAEMPYRDVTRNTQRDGNPFTFWLLQSSPAFNLGYIGLNMSDDSSWNNYKCCVRSVKPVVLIIQAAVRLEIQVFWDMPHHLNGQPVQERWSSWITSPLIWRFSDPLKHCLLFTNGCGVTSQKTWINSPIWKLQNLHSPSNVEFKVRSRQIN